MDQHSHDEHVFESIGKCRVTIRHGQVVDICEPRIKGCPLAKKFEIPVDEISTETVKEHFDQRIRSFGMCTPRRKVSSDQEFFSFAPMELLACGLRSGLIDAIVFACDGAGTVIVTDPAMVQGIGGWMSGLISTSPIPEVIDRIEEHGGVVLDRVTARLDPVGGVNRAKKMGFSSLAVPVSDPEIAEIIRANNPDALLFGVHLSGITEEEAQRIVAVSDLVTAGSSKIVIDLAEKKSLLQVGAIVPIFALSPKGKELIMNRILEANK